MLKAVNAFSFSFLLGGAMYRVQIVLDEDEAKALVKLAEIKIRDPRDQIRVLVRSELERQGLLRVHDLALETADPSDNGTGEA
jgi:hypothetical protein